MGSMLEIRGLTKEFGPVRVVDNISFSLDRGEVLGFLGPNGAGKSTTMRMVTGYLPPTAGTAIVCGHDVTRDTLAAKRAIGYLPEGAPLYEEMTPSGLLAFAGGVRGLSGNARARAVDAAVEKLELRQVLHQRIGTLSKGFKRRVGLAQAILHDPDVLVLDEPTDGLDPNQKHQVRELIRQMSEEKAIIISTHILEEVDAVCTRVIVIAQGRMIADGTPADLERRSVYCNAVSIRLPRENLARLHEALQGLEGIERIVNADDRSESAHAIVMPRNGGAIINAVNARLKEEALAVDQLYVERGRLEDVFRTITIGESER